jgi:DNA polymerase-3 subunit alpha (Gram-positive type)
MDKELNAIIQNKNATLYVLAMKLVKKTNQDGFLVGSRARWVLVRGVPHGHHRGQPLAAHWRCASGHWHEFPEKPGTTRAIDMAAKDAPMCGERAIRDGFNIAFEVFMASRATRCPISTSTSRASTSMRRTVTSRRCSARTSASEPATISAVKDKIAYGFVKKFLEEQGIKARRGRRTAW